MTEVTNNKLIYITRGDSLNIPFKIELGNPIDPEVYFLQPEDALYFGVMEVNAPFECGLIRKEYTEADQEEDGTINIILEPTDTICLLPGTYHYEIKLKQANGDVTTLINRRRFVILD